LALGTAAHAHGLHELFDVAGGHAIDPFVGKSIPLYVGFNDRDVIMIVRSVWPEIPLV
jgi:hypothetical protein